MTVITLVPFPAAMLGRFGYHRLAVIWYGGNVAAAAATLQLHWWYSTTNRRMVDAGVTEAIVRRVSERLWFSIIIYPIAMLIVLVNVKVSLVIYIIVPILYIIPVAADFHWFGRPDTPKPSST